MFLFFLWFDLTQFQPTAWRMLQLALPEEANQLELQYNSYAGINGAAACVQK